MEDKLQQKRLRDLTLLRELGLRLAAAADPQTIYDLGVEYAVRLLDASGAFLHLYDPARDAGRAPGGDHPPTPPAPSSAPSARTGLTFVAGPGLPGRPRQSFGPPRPGGLTHTVARTGQPLVVNDPASHPLYGPDAAARLNFKTIVGYPLTRAGHVYAVLTVAFVHPHPIEAAEVDLLALLAEQLVRHIENARLHEQTEHRARQLSLLNDLGQQLAGSLDAGALYALTVRALVERFGYGLAIIVELSPTGSGTAGPREGGGEFVLVAKAGAAAEKLALGRRVALAGDPQGRGVLAHVLQAGQTYLTNHAAEDSRYAQWENIQPGSELCVPIRVAGEVIGALNVEEPFPDAFTPSDRDMLESLSGQLGAALGHARHFQRMRRTAERLALLNRATEQIARAPDRAAALAATLNAACELVQAERGGIFVAEPDGRLALAHTCGVAPEVEAALKARTFTATTGLFGVALRAKHALEIPDTAADPRVVHLPGYTGQAIYCAPLAASGGPIALLDLDRLPPDDEVRALLAAFCDRAAVAIENAALYEETARLAQERAALLDISTALSGVTDLQAVLQRALQHIRATFKVDACSFTVLAQGGQALKTIAQLHVAAEHKTGEVGDIWPLERLPLSRRALATQRAYAYADLPAQSEVPPEQREWLLRHNQKSSAHVPLVANGQTVGLLYLTVFGRVRHFTEAELSLAQGMANQAAIALQRAQLYDQTQRRLQRLEILRAIDAAITASVDLRPILSVLLDQVTSRLGLHAADVLLYDPHTRTLNYAAGRGFRTRSGEGARVRLGEGRAGRAALDRRIVHISGEAVLAHTSPRTGQLSGEAFTTYFAVPLVAKGQIKGVLELFHRAPFDASAEFVPGGPERSPLKDEGLSADPEWLEFLEALGAQAAIAIDNASMFSDLQRAHVELSVAYDDTIEGWARALDLRDKEAEGHAQHIADLTLRLARTLGVAESELMHLRRGALLHDIGKMGIPDGILLKPGPLTEAEWATMRKHPAYAYEMLAPIAHLRPALDIPYCHHERWDGTGYPRGLKGDAIPLVARIFAVVDVWDALTSERLYRAAWSEAKARAYLREQAGKLFESRIVEAFLALMAQEGASGI